MLRNLIISNGCPFRPGRTCRKKIGVPSLTRTRTATSTRTGKPDRRAAEGEDQIDRPLHVPAPCLSAIATGEALASAAGRVSTLDSNHMNAIVRTVDA